MLRQAYSMRLLVPLIDGIDEAAGLKKPIEDFIVDELVPKHMQVVVTSRPEGVRLWLYQFEWVIMNLAKLTDEQSSQAVNAQLGSNTFFENATRFSTIRRGQEDNYEKAFASQELRDQIESFSADNHLEKGGPDARQQIAMDGGSRVVQSRESEAQSDTLKKLDEALGTHKLLTSLQTELEKLEDATQSTALRSLAGCRLF